MCPTIEDPFVYYDCITREAFGHPDERVHEQKRDASDQIVYDERRLALVAVK